MSNPLPRDVNDATVVRVSRDGKQVALRLSDGTYASFSTSGGLISEALELDILLEEGSWRRPASDEAEALVASIAESDVSEAEGSRPYRVPDQVREAVLAVLAKDSASFSTEDIARAESLASGDPVGRDEVVWIRDYFQGNDDSDMLRGGFKGRKWAEKILDEDGSEYDPYAKYQFPDTDEWDYMALGPDEDSPEANRLLQVNWDSGMVLEWSSDGFDLLYEDDLNTLEFPMVIPIDAATAGVLARWLDENPYQTYDLRDADPDERNLFDTSYDEMDFEDIDRTASILADASGYTPAERSLNARRQVRGFHGRFGGRQVKQTSKLKAFKKGKLSGEPPIDPTPGKTIKSWLADHDTVTAAAAPKQGRSQSIAQPAANPVGKSQVSADKTEQLVGKEAKQAAEDNEVGGLDDAVYFAIVDANDSTAVLDMVAITRNEDGQPEAWRRVKGEWKGDPDTLAKLMGSTPPAVVQITDPDVLKAVLQQVDFTDENPGKLPTDAVTDSAPPSLQASGRLVIEDVDDLKAFVVSLDGAVPDDETKIVARRRAKALNRMDIIPSEWRAASHAERGMELALASPLMGEYGEVLTAAGHPFQGAKGAERLKEYWTHGKGALKVRWGTRGDLTRAHRHLAKFVGPDRAWGLAERYHEYLFGMSNRKHDKLTGQYDSHRK